MKTLELFNGVIAKKNDNDPYVCMDNGIIIESSALHMKDYILLYYSQNRLDGNDLNKTFHRSWNKIKTSTRFELFVDQIKHYVSTYGSNFNDEIYIPNEILNIEGLNLKFKVVKGFSENQLKDKALSLLKSGIALKEETINDILTILVDELKYEFTGNEGIRNKEAIIKIADMYGVLPNDTIEFFRYIIYRATGESLLIKNHKIIGLIKNSNFNPSAQFNKFGLERLAEIFNRFKPLFLAFKKRCPKTINRISKLSKQYHKPLVSNPLNKVTSTLLKENDLHWLDNATPFALFKAISACYSRMGGQDTFVYRIRNGKSFVKENSSTSVIAEKNYNFILNYMKENYDLSDMNIYLPKDVEYALPTSEKMFVGNVPTGTKFYGNALAVGVYWKNSWGANDLDLSGLNIGGKVGWNSSYKQNGSLYFSGDITNAPNGAVEYLYANRGLSEPTLVINNVFRGLSDSKYKIIVGKGDNITKNFMMNPEKLFVDIKTQCVESQMVVGIFLPEGNEKQVFVLLNFGAGSANVSRFGKNSELSTKALFQQWTNTVSFKNIIEYLGAKIVDDPEIANIDYSLDSLEKDSFTSLFQKKEKEVLV